MSETLTSCDLTVKLCCHGPVTCKLRLLSCGILELAKYLNYLGQGLRFRCMRLVIAMKNEDTVLNWKALVCALYHCALCTISMFCKSL